MASVPALSLVILTEDSGIDGRATVEALVRRMLQLVAPGYGRQRIDFLPRDAAEAEAMRGNLWKSDGKNPAQRERQVRLLRYIVRQLSLPNTFVLFHIDGDRVWKERDSSENVAKFERLIRNKLPQVADRGRANNATARPATGEPPAAAPMLHLEHLLLVCPFRSIESWVYQNLQKAVEICHREHRGAHVVDLREWARCRDELDELAAPEVTVCLGKRFNLELASTAFPAHEAYETRKSFAETVDRLIRCDALRQALEQTRM